MTLSPGRSLVDKQRIPSVEFGGDGVGHPGGPATRRGCRGGARTRRGGPPGPATRRACRRRSGTGCEDLPVPVPLVIDTDPGIDDALAILLALASPEVDLRLVTTVHGNVEVPQTTDNALRVLHLAGRSDVPVAAGAAESLVFPQPARAGHV